MTYSIYIQYPQDNTIISGYFSEKGDLTFWPDLAWKFDSIEEANREIEERGWIIATYIIDGKTTAYAVESKD